MELLSTIKLPKNMKLLTDRLPKANYQSNYSGGDTDKQLTDVPSTKSLTKHEAVKTRSRKQAITNDSE